MKRRMWSFAAGLIVLVLLVSACGDDTDQSENPSPTAPAPASPTVIAAAPTLTPGGATRTPSPTVPPTITPTETAPPPPPTDPPLGVQGRANFLLLGVVVALVLMSGLWKSSVEFDIWGTHVGLPGLVRDGRERVVLRTAPARRLAALLRPEYCRLADGWRFYH